MRVLTVAAAVAGLAAGSLAMASSQEPAGSGQQPIGEEATVKDGVYTPGQAVRGRARYEASCQRCHGADLTGGAGRSLTGVVFLRDWTGLTLDGLYERMQSMPPDGSENLSEDAYVDIISYVLERNGFPPGAAELSAGLLGHVRVEGEDGPGVVPNFALVRVVGCLTGDAHAGWSLSAASPEVRASDPAPSTGDALAEAQAIPLGDRAFKLLYVFPSPEAHLGHKVETKGLLIRAEGTETVDSLNVTSVQGLGEACEERAVSP